MRILCRFNCIEFYALIMLGTELSIKPIPGEKLINLALARVNRGGWLQVYSTSVECTPKPLNFVF